ncbi:50S ribosomal protein L4 [Sulfoacidibacillus thermotolerans]|uniref:Large ribosomal subunit protein uL4 n=1 Tax=Sulfoacidibacillus thermotolerans TaxID=1765684 RepID=A0A2U3DBF9_SULT2|nr:50S ribosomal protein L4 [Sulfoacidibacillus thermotolerans]PWI58618.1 50S ribosomal protein L4 [Sulfoacidibacillus thermotolerans]
MPKVPVYNMSGAAVGEIELSDAVWNAPVHQGAMFDVVQSILASRRAGTHKVKGRSEVRGGGRKPWKQKGTGRARQGSIRSPQWVGGGTVHGPTPRSYAYQLPKKIRRLALRSALTTKVQAGTIIVLDELAMQEVKTKRMHEALKALGITSKALLVDATKSENVYLSVRNIPGTSYCAAEGLNVYDVLAYDRLVITKAGVARVEEVFAK